MQSAEHALTHEELMAYLDGEVSSERRQQVEQHVRECTACRAAVEEFRQVSRLAAHWTVEEAPASLRAPHAQTQPTTWRRLTLRQRVFASCATAAVLIGLVLVRAPGLPLIARFADEFDLMAPPAANSIEIPASQGQVGRAAELRQPAAPAREATPPARQPQVTRTASLRITAGNLDRVRAAIEQITEKAGGFVEALNATSTPRAARAVHATLRIPAANLSTALAELRALGQVVDDAQASTDVSDQIVDLETRLANARTTERRLAAVLGQSGTIADVLEVEREIGRVRGEIEQLDAERTNVSRRVAYATVTVTIEEQRADIARPTLLAQLGDAVAQGFRGAADTLVGAMVLVLITGPTVTLWLVVAGAVWVSVRRIRRMFA